MFSTTFLRVPTKNPQLVHEKKNEKNLVNNFEGNYTRARLA